ncbi:hypothetical protein MGU_10209 [Metarhizium guizhouense ARSEF 977]|uniref:Uncharacterized protein n=1 Tax=Metarhizium guizhouense (strain ARSEF 977) TaxID=1276136 RepID=A0A0B4G716_METGA|nr:hypothetical protein MGU_10209 [Metarhizium guizhouense ARSEF 977]
MSQRGSGDIKPEDESRSDLSQLAYAIESLKLDTPPNARVAFAASELGLLLPLDAEQVSCKGKTYWFVHQASQISSFYFKLRGISCKGYFHKQANCVTLENAADTSLECTPNDNGKLDIENRGPFCPDSIWNITAGPWRVSSSEGTWVDGYVFPTTHEFTVDRKRRRTEDQRSPAGGRDRTCDLANRGTAPVYTYVSGSLMVADPLVIACSIRVLFPSTPDPVPVNSPYKHGRSIQIRPKRRALGQLDGRESYVLRSHAAETWQTTNMRLWNATHSNFGPVTIWELLECETIPKILRTPVKLPRQGT